MLRRHHQLAPDKCSFYLTALITSAASQDCKPWQRIACLQVRRGWGLHGESVVVMRAAEASGLEGFGLATAGLGLTRLRVGLSVSPACR